MHTNAFRSPQDKAWKGLPHGRNVSSAPAGAGVAPASLATPGSAEPAGAGAPASWHCRKLGAASSRGILLLSQFLKHRVRKEASRQRVSSTVHVKKIPRFRRESSLARVPTRAAPAPAAPELGSDARPAAAPAALAPGSPSPPSGPWLRSCPPAGLLRAPSLGIAGALAVPWARRAAGRAGHGPGQGCGMGGEGARGMSSVRAPLDPRGSGAVSSRP